LEGLKRSYPSERILLAPFWYWGFGNDWDLKEAALVLDSNCDLEQN
jgi:hypothetical protein